MNLNALLQKTSARRLAFTLIEMLTVIAVIGILASMLLPALAHGKVSVQVKAAQAEMSSLVAAISTYQGDYGRLPASSTVTKNAGNGDFTFGTVDNTGNLAVGATSTGVPRIQNPPSVPYNAWNSEVMAVLIPSIPNANLTLNPRKSAYFTFHTAAQPGTAGLGPDNVLRDIFGNPYIITLDLNYDGVCRDAYYSTMTNYATFYPKDIQGSVLVWSFGPDKGVNVAGTTDLLLVKSGKNKDNIVSW